ncbi:hypothetical protein FPQ18DRAFT_404230 [Pyronema domesticum]|uniref:Uncharacterized protein n=1 Tax=Pyronema omphalodes (strain CBS 100304) TaxID=1076935 RepID=U4LE18_PYROM|nr:hypothetical protein FPQ18DRAFT_404230 [Pyronema domesticum]CCX29772.1 Protein of unknown function [Pyronema omphalodes CBS 100304]
MDFQALTALDQDMSTSVSPVHTPPGNTPSPNTPTATTPTSSVPQSPTITPHKERMTQDQVSNELLSFVELSQRLQDAAAANELEKSMLRDEIYQLKLHVKEVTNTKDVVISKLKDENNQSKALLTKMENDLKTQLKIFEEESAQLKTELERASKYGGLNLFRDMERLLKKNDELEQRLTENQSEIQQFVKQQLAEIKKQTEKDSQEATKSLNSINTKIEDIEQKLDQQVTSLDGYNLESIKSKLLELEKTVLPTEFNEFGYFSRTTRMKATSKDIIEVSKTLNGLGPYIYVKREKIWVFKNIENFIMREWGLDLTQLKDIYITKHMPTKRTQWKFKTLSEWQNVEPLILGIRLDPCITSKQSLGWSVVCTLQD